MKEKYYTVAKTISRWKLDNWFENFLGYKADTSEIWKRLYILYYKIFDNQYYKGGVELSAKEIHRQYNHKSILGKIGFSKLQRDMIYSLHRFGASFEDYFIYQFYDKNHYGRERFTNLKLQYGYCELVNADSVRVLFEDKGACYKRLQKYYKRDLCVVYGKDDFPEYEEFMCKHHSFILKPLTGHSGIGITIFDNFSDDIKIFYDEMIAQGAFVIEELIHQHPALAVLHPNSINTVRIATFKNNNDVTIIGCALRMGTGGSNVDNAGSGGIYANIDVKYGMVSSIARDNLNNQHIIHPDSKCKIVGFELPEWDNAIKMIKEIALSVNEASVIAWDLAYCDKGWIIVEGNDVGDPYLLQAPLQQGIKGTMTTLIDKHFQ